MRSSLARLRLSGGLQLPQPATWAIRRFFDANRRLSARIESRLPHARDDLYAISETTVAEYMNGRPRQLVVDGGDGRSCPFAKYRDPRPGTRIMAIDVSEDEIRHNRQPGGVFIHLSPSRFAPFAVINRALPHWLSRRLLDFLQPQVVGICGFPASYDRCYFTALAGLLTAHEFQIEQHRLRYYRSRYFNFFVPAYLASIAYEVCARATQRRDLAACVLVVARKR